MATHKQEHRPLDDANPQSDVHSQIDPNEVPPEGIEPDLTPPPGTQRGLPDAAAAPGQQQSQSQGARTDDPGFDPESPDLADPQVDPIGPATIPDDAPGMQVKKRVNDDRYPPYNKQ